MGAQGLRVVELSHMVAAPVTGMILADLGADVVKVEPADGDAARGFGERDERNLSALFRTVNRGKRSAVIDLTTDEGKRRLASVLAGADCLITNYRPSALRRLGIDADTLRIRYPHLVIACTSAYPAPHDDWAGVDINALGLSGLMAASGWPGMAPVRPAIPLADMVTGILAATAVLDAVMRRTETGDGAVLQLALTETMLYLSQTLLAHAEETGRAPERLGNGSPFGFTGVFAAADGYVSLAAPSDRLFGKLCQALRRPDLADRFSDHEARRLGCTELAAEMESALAARTVDEWIILLRSQGVPCARVNSALDALTDPEAAGPGFLRGDADRLDVALPWTVDGQRRRSARPAPMLGEHTTEVAP